ncbi:hypothetical protein SYNPS1DRAFT_21284 [Syncephalis pseudoplumigaleata]|uniref:Uncharacterized protein n=1 Tax=Syncephalis pseudoplumigaleata TaxID=1712513 RepID=A0A4P9Z5N2_9FUNG|nr:hypothetical protein SYNPS1DRAFT_21284 [Syncephalis pseudoplumigaleata]|eukprot:RKP27111.1 hypothetical protein SYNPS1DRAFT_21284 [Syncephalis pseudoplumigaleata]
MSFQDAADAYFDPSGYGVVPLKLLSVELDSKPDKLGTAIASGANEASEHDAKDMPASAACPQDSDDPSDSRPYTVHRTFYQFRLLIVGLYREFLDRPDITVVLHEAAADIFSACPEAERLCVHALLDTFLVASNEQMALLGSRSLAEFFARWPVDRAREDLEQSSRDINSLFDTWDDLQSKPPTEERPVYSSQASVWSMDMTVPATPDKPDTPAASTDTHGESAAPVAAPLRRGKSVLASVGMRAMRKAVGKASSIFAHAGSAPSAKPAASHLAVSDAERQHTTTTVDAASLCDLPQADADRPIGELFADELISALERVSKTEGEKLVAEKPASIFGGHNASNSAPLLDTGSSSSHKDGDKPSPKLSHPASPHSDDAAKDKAAISATASLHDYDGSESITNDCDSGNDSRGSSSFELIPSRGNSSSNSSLKIASPTIKRSLSIRSFRRKQPAQSDDATEASSSQQTHLESGDATSISSESSRLSRRLTGSFRVVKKNVIKRVSSKNSTRSTEDSASASLPSLEVTAPLAETKSTGSVAPRRVASSNNLLGVDMDAFEDAGHMSDIEPRPMSIPTPRSSTPPPSIKLGSRASMGNMADRRATLNRLQAAAPWNAPRDQATGKDKAAVRLSLDVHGTTLARSHSARADLPQRPASLMRTASNASFFSSTSSGVSLRTLDDSPVRASTAPGSPHFSSPATPTVYVHPAGDDYFSSMPASPLDPLCDLPLDDGELAGDIVVQIALDRKHLVRLVVPRSCTLDELCNQAEDKFMRCLEMERVLEGRELLYVQRDGRALLVVNDAALGRVLARAAWWLDLLSHALEAQHTASVPSSKRSSLRMVGSPVLPSIQETAEKNGGPPRSEAASPSLLSHVERLLHRRQHSAPAASEDCRVLQVDIPSCSTSGITTMVATPADEFSGSGFYYHHDNGHSLEQMMCHNCKRSPTESMAQHQAVKVG